MATGFFCDVLTLLTLGLYFPLGVVRMARLRRESLRVTALTGAIQGEQHSSAPMPVAVPEPRTHWTLALGLMATPLILAVWMKLYGKPVLSEWLVRAMPASLNTAVGEAALRQLQREGVRPSVLSQATQQQLREGWQRAARAAWPAGMLPPYRVEFVHGGDVLGPNAIALPGDTILVTDELLALVAGQPDPSAVLLGVMGHELAHLVHQHPQRILLLASLRKSLGMVLLGGRGEDDLLASGANTVLYQGYALKLQQDADQGSVRMLQANGRDPAVMVRFLKDLEAARTSRPAWTVAAQRVPISLAAQPVDTPRLESFMAGPHPAGR